MISSYHSLYEILQNSLHELGVKFHNKYPQELYMPQEYILSLGGKRIRPLMALVGCDLFNVSPQKAIPAALSVELFHNFSLIHDDIMDNAPLRRGKDTVHEKWNQNIAILSGDSMLVKAYETLCLSDSKTLPDLLRIFTKTAHEVCEGQQMDMNFENNDSVNLDEYTKMISLKTAVLLGCSLQMGSICAGADENSQICLYEFGKELGIAFQIHDDLLDTFPESNEFGKQVGGDIISNKKTFLLLKALEIANEEQLKSIRFWFSQNNTDNQTKINEVKKIYQDLAIHEYCKTQSEYHFDKALSSLNLLNVDPVKKEHLLNFSKALMNRKF